MRNLFLVLVLANLLLLAWHAWVAPEPVPPVAAAGQPGLSLFTSPGRQASADPGRLAGPTGGRSAAQAPAPAGACVQVGPWASDAAAQQASQELAAQGVTAIPVARETQVWLGHWVQIGGFDSVAAADAARQRLTDGGLTDAYLMQEGEQPLLSLGVFREQSRADRVAAVAGGLGYRAVLRDRYRPAVEQWLLIRPRPGQQFRPESLRLGDDRILRLEAAPCRAEPGSGPPGDMLPDAAPDP